jgi:hypothetical protein
MTYFMRTLTNCELQHEVFFFCALPTNPPSMAKNVFVNLFCWEYKPEKKDILYNTMYIRRTEHISSLIFILLCVQLNFCFMYFDALCITVYIVEWFLSGDEAF